MAKKKESVRARRSGRRSGLFNLIVDCWFQVFQSPGKQIPATKRPPSTELSFRAVMRHFPKAQSRCFSYLFITSKEKKRKEEKVHIKNIEKISFIHRSTQSKLSSSTCSNFKILKEFLGLRSAMMGAEYVCEKNVSDN